MSPTRDYEAIAQELQYRVDQLEAALAQAHPIVAYVSSGRGYIGVEPYPDATARRVNALIGDLLSHTSVPDCFWHGPEPDRAEDYKVCGECGHVWRTEREFIQDLLWQVYEMRSPLGMTIITAPDKVHSCPLCAHDF